MPHHDRSSFGWPLLSLKSGSLYTVCFRTDPSVRQTQVCFNGQSIAAQAVGTTWSGVVWRAELALPLREARQQVRYEIRLDDQLAYNQDGCEWTFHVPGKAAKPRLLYASCNGFSSPDLAVKTERPYILWGKIRKFQIAEMAKAAAGDAASPYALMLLGGDQLYADDLWTHVPLLRKWSAMSARTRSSRPRFPRRCPISSTGFMTNCTSGAGASRTCR